MSEKIPFTPLVRTLPATVPFVGPEALERQRGSALKVRLGANESAFGISPYAAEAMRAEIARVSWYADPEGHELKTEIARQFSINIHEVCLGGGVDELLGLVVRSRALKKRNWRACSSRDDYRQAEQQTCQHEWW